MKRRYVWRQAAENPSGPLCKVHSSPAVLSVYVTNTMATDTVFKGTMALPATEFPTFSYAGKSFQPLLPWSFSNCHL